MHKKIAILVRDRKQEALRMAVGATLMNDDVNVFVMNDKLEKDEQSELNLEMLKDLKVRVLSNVKENNFEFRTTEDIAGMLTAYDIVLPY